MKTSKFLCFGLLFPILAPTFAPPQASAEAPEGYYASVAGLSGDALREGLHGIVMGHHVIPYASSSTFDVHDGIDLLDESPTDMGAVVLLYSSASADKLTWPGYNREHVWPQSLGAEEGSPAHSDLHHIFACDANVNSSRGNKPFDDCTEGCDAHAEAPEAFYDDDSWEPPDYHKGDVARALLYMDVRYEGEGGEPQLRLIDAVATEGCDCIGWVSQLLEWHLLDPVDGREAARNDGVFEIQGNRNPFIDHPEWVCDVYPLTGCALGGDPIGEGTPFPPDPTPPSVDTPTPDPTPGWEPTPLPEPTPGEDPEGPLRPFINELHYDNEGADEGEGVEVAGIAGVDLEGFKIVFYNGADTAVYGEVRLGGSLPDEGAGMGARFFPVAGIQNGGADGLALVGPAGEVLEFLSYEGALRPITGPAAGMDSVPIPVAEDGTTPSGMSLQRVGIGCRGGDFEWVGPTASSPGHLNEGQGVQLPEAEMPTPEEPSPTPFDVGTETPNPIDDPRVEIYVAQAVPEEDGALVERRSRGQAAGRAESASGTLSLGDDGAGRARRVVLSFDTGAIPDGRIVGVTLRLVPTEVVGTPFEDLGPATLGLGLGGIGPDAALSLEDWDAISELPFGGWVESLPAEGEADIAISVPLEGVVPGPRTQISLAFAVEDDGDRSADMISFGSGDSRDPALRPVLEIAYLP